MVLVPGGELVIGGRLVVVGRGLVVGGGLVVEIGCVDGFNVVLMVPLFDVLEHPPATIKPETIKTILP